MNDSVQNKIINSFFLMFGGSGLLWLSLQDDFIFIYVHPVSIFSIIFFSVGIFRCAIQFRRYRLKGMIYEIFVIGLIVFSLLVANLIDAAVLKSDKVFEAIIIDDLSSIHLVLRKDGSFETISNTIYGGGSISGEYILLGDTIVFKDKPHDNDFIPSRILIDKERQRVWIKRKISGEFDTTEYFAGFFEIRYDELK